MGRQQQQPGVLTIVLVRLFLARWMSLAVASAWSQDWNGWPHLETCPERMLSLHNAALLNVYLTGIINWTLSLPIPPKYVRSLHLLSCRWTRIPMSNTFSLHHEGRIAFASNWFSYNSGTTKWHSKWGHKKRIGQPTKAKKENLTLSLLCILSCSRSPDGAWTRRSFNGKNTT